MDHNNKNQLFEWWINKLQYTTSFYRWVKHMQCTSCVGIKYKMRFQHIMQSITCVMTCLGCNMDVVAQYCYPVGNPTTNGCLQSPRACSWNLSHSLVVQILWRVEIIQSWRIPFPHNNTHCSFAMYIKIIMEHPLLKAPCMQWNGKNTERLLWWSFWPWKWRIHERKPSWVLRSCSEWLFLKGLFSICWSIHIHMWKINNNNYYYVWAPIVVK